ncbi:hypothetical protein T492DRAFT_1032106, partial [Pavlovales sp. CCMP2436]
MASSAPEPSPMAGSTCLACHSGLAAGAGVTYAPPCEHGRLHQLCFLELSLGQELVLCPQCDGVWAVMEWTKWVQAPADETTGTRGGKGRQRALPAPTRSPVLRAPRPAGTLHGRAPMDAACADLADDLAAMRALDNRAQLAFVAVARGADGAAPLESYKLHAGQPGKEYVGRAAAALGGVAREFLVTRPAVTGGETASDETAAARGIEDMVEGFALEAAPLSVFFWALVGAAAGAVSIVTGTARALSKLPAAALALFSITCKALSPAHTPPFAELMARMMLVTNTSYSVKTMLSYTSVAELETSARAKVTPHTTLHRQSAASWVHSTSSTRQTAPCFPRPNSRASRCGPATSRWPLPASPRSFSRVSPRRLRQARTARPVA